MLILSALVLAGFVFISFVVVPFVTRPAMLVGKGTAHARMMGILICGFVAVAAFFLLDPDHVSALKPRAWEAVALAAFSAIFWMPWYLFAFSRSVRAAKEHI